MKTLSVSCMFLWLILAALAFGAVFDGLGAVRAIETLFITQWELSPWTIIIMMQISFLLLGMFLDDTAMLVIVAPLYIPLVGTLDLGFDNQLIWYGILYTITCQIAYITPPFGYNLFLMRSLAPKEITLVGHLPLDLALCRDHDADDRAVDDLPADRALAARTDQRAGLTPEPPPGPTEAHNDRRERHDRPKKPLSPSEAILASRRNFLRQSVVGAGAVAGATLAAPYVNAQSAPIKWRLQTYSGAPLGCPCDQAADRRLQRRRQWRDGDRAVLRRPAGPHRRPVPRPAERHPRRRAVGRGDDGLAGRHLGVRRLLPLRHPLQPRCAGAVPATTG